ncbi:MAG TPA: SWIM zinc finger family protein [Bacteroidia bacterium]|nr:SWIM zinc finger family protein [Bacteroidia bacterium]
MESELTLASFRNELDEAVLERGWLYFSNGWVSRPREILPHYYECVVEEVNPHAVSFSRNPDGTFTDIFCTCGDRLHSACRHMAAVLFLLESHQGESIAPPGVD